ncbi:6-carboxytetrahydropterin synthase [Lactiplantibacillus plantarum]|uniref:6-carboxytetrahydropterin synthase n=1 Tax=Lactiplantibacillus plantarum TaxID=1590 RepID=UPI002306E372|nr:6-carboxytetrahydropterin synthase [Lactiplantibacillus plantarum]WCE43533.1 6-carboxytetrahydropterin synthase [Lactiplantibacillus plantarum]
MIALGFLISVRINYRICHIEKNLHQALDELSGKFLNDLPEFKTVNPTVENVTEYLFTKIDKTLRDNGAQLLRIEVSDSPTRAYCISVTE